MLRPGRISAVPIVNDPGTYFLSYYRQTVDLLMTRWESEARITLSPV